MTEQIKKEAEDVVNKFLPEIQGADRYNYNLDSMNLFIAKQCAIIHLDLENDKLEKVKSDIDDNWLYYINELIGKNTQLKQYIKTKM